MQTMRFAGRDTLKPTSVMSRPRSNQCDVHRNRYYAYHSAH